MLLKQKVPTRDQVELCTDVYLPKTNEPGPTVVVRTPYGRSGPFFLYLAQHLNRAGFALAIQDCRGRFDSGGKQDWRRETDDGYDTLVWLQTQSWCDGKIGLLGLSTAAHSCIALAARQPPEGIEIGAMINMMGAADFHSLFYRNGALVLHWSLPWLHMMGAKQGTGGAWRKQPWNELFRTVPLTQVPEGDQFDLSPWREVLAHPAEGDFWKDLDASP
ncbi:MAG: CocE/NonD family hydrolase, partial [bacterium]|nr:CocE/NonD family hydrolase [bacterium]